MSEDSFIQIDDGFKIPEPEINCQECEEQLKKQKTDIKKKAEQDVKDKANQALGKLQITQITELKNSIAQCLNVINGYEDPDDPNFKPEKILNNIISMLDPIIAPLKELPVPDIPILSDIIKLIDSLTGMLKPSSFLPESEITDRVPNKPQLSPSTADIIQEFSLALTSIVALLPFVLINMIFKCLEAIIKMFEEVADKIGVPDIPPPLPSVKDAIKLLPSIFKFIQTGPGQINNVMKGIIRKKLQESAALQIPKIPTNIVQIKPHSDHKNNNK